MGKWDNTQMNEKTCPPAGVDTTLLPCSRPVILVGMMGAGKTTIGRGLAKVTGRDFIDLDHAIEARCGVSIPHIFEVEGEEGFRKRETQLLDEYSQQPGIVLATGGGAVLAPENRHMLCERGVVIYLRANADELYRRVAKDRNRPLLHTPNPRERVAQLLALRAPLYEEVADITFDTGTLPVNQAAHALVQLLKSTTVSL